jgi:hypothetical protein
VRRGWGAKTTRCLEGVIGMLDGKCSQRIFAKSLEVTRGMVDGYLMFVLAPKLVYNGKSCPLIVGSVLYLAFLSSPLQTHGNSILLHPILVDFALPFLHRAWFKFG